MKRKVQQLIARIARTRTSGQSIPLIVLMIVGLVGMVGLAVDVGNTYAEQRKVVSGSNAAAIAGMDAYIKGGNATTDQEVFNAITNSLRANRIDVGTDPGQLQLDATYLGADGKPVTNGCPKIGCGGNAPRNVAFIKVEIKGTVDTFFARVVGRPTLPIDATSYATQCPPSSGVYPIAVDSNLIDGNKFRDPGTGNASDYGTIRNGNFRGYTYRRIYVHDNGVPGSFSWLRWKEDKDPNGYSAKSENALQASMTGAGNLNQGFDEAEWPSTGLPKPAVYPEKPGQLNAGDWVHGSSGQMRSKDIRGLLDGHLGRGTVLVLPIYDMAVGSGANGVFRVSRLGAFVLLGYNDSNGSQPYLDLLFLGDAQNNSGCTTAAVQPDTIGLSGSVEIWPEYRTAPSSQRPVQYVVVLDVSGSMNFDFEGKGKRPGTNETVQCSNSADPIANANRQACSSPNNAAWAWQPVEQRRIYVAKQAINRLIDLMNIPGNANYNSARPNDQLLLITFNDGVRNTFNWSSDSATLKQQVLQAGAAQGGSYTTTGGTNGASGLFRAAQRLQSTSNEVTHNGQKYEYKRAVIFVTDGVSNHFLDTSNPNGSLRGDVSDRGSFPNGHTCRDDPNVLENAECQTTQVGGVYTKSGRSFERPITQMVLTSNQNLKPLSDVYVVALSAIPATGLRDGVASFPSFYAEARTLVTDSSGKTNVDKIFENIFTQIEYGQCSPQADNKWLMQITPEGGPNTYPQVGEVFITESSSGANYKAPIVANTDGYLSYSFNNIPQGTYLLTAYVLYKHPRDIASLSGDRPLRQYELIYSGEKTYPDGVTVTVKPSSDNFGGVVTHDIKLKLAGDVCAAN